MYTLYCCSPSFDVDTNWSSFITLFPLHYIYKLKSIPKMISRVSYYETYIKLCCLACVRFHFHRDWTLFRGTLFHRPRGSLRLSVLGLVRLCVIVEQNRMILGLQGLTYIQKAIVRRHVLTNLCLHHQ